MWTRRSRSFFWILSNLLCLGVFLKLLPLHTASPVVLSEVVSDPLSIPEDSIISDDNTKSESKDDSDTKLDLSGYTDVELARLARVLQKELEDDSSPLSGIEFVAPFQSNGPIWVIPASQAEAENPFPRDKRSLLEEEEENSYPLDLQPKEDREIGPVPLVVMEENPRITSTEELLAAPLTEEEVDEIELRQRLDELGDFLKQRASSTNDA